MLISTALADSLTGAQAVDTVEEYVDLLKGLDRNQVIYGLAALVIGLVLSHFIIKLVFHALDRGSVVAPSVRTFVKTMLRILLAIIVVMVSANIMGIPITSFVALFSVIGIAISLGVQGLLTNFVGGMIILVTHPFEVGHFVENETLIGTVEEIGIMHTRLRAPDGRTIFLPNGTLYASRIINYSMSENRRIELTVSAAYGNSPEKVRGAILDAVDKVPALLKDPEPVIHVESYGDSAITYSMYVWCPGSELWNAKYALNEQLYYSFAQAGVEMTYPHLNVHMK